MIQVDTGRYTDHHRNIFDPDWHPLPCRITYPPEPYLPRPALLDTMLDVARKLSAGHPFVRVDLYEIGTRVVFGEMTWYPGAGIEPIEPLEWDHKLGEWLQLPKEAT